MNQPSKFNCPTCNKAITWSEKYPFRPFCCERCKLIDLGEWASEKHAIPGEPHLNFDDEESY